MQINIDPQKLSGTDLQIRIPSSNNDIFFGERMFYNDYVKAGLCLDITDIALDGNDVTYTVNVKYEGTKVAEN